MLGLFVNVRSVSLGSFRMSIVSNPCLINGYVHHRFLLFLFYSLSKMEAAINIEFLHGINEQVIKEAAVVSDDVVQSYLFHPPYHMEPHGSDENALKWADGHIPNNQVKLY